MVESNQHSPVNIVMVGPPGSGKGTQAAKICEELNLKNVSTGEMLRKEIRSGSELGKQIDHLWRTGKNVTDDMVNNIVEKFYSEMSEGRGLLLDGYPRTI